MTTPPRRAAGTGLAPRAARPTFGGPVARGALPPVRAGRTVPPAAAPGAPRAPFRPTCPTEPRASDILRALILRQAGTGVAAGKPSLSAAVSGEASGVAPDQMPALLLLWWPVFCHDVFGGPMEAALALGKCEKTGRNYRAGRGPDAATVAWIMAEVEGARDHLRRFLIENGRGL